MSQLQMFPETPVEWLQGSIALVKLPEDGDLLSPEPDPAFCQDIAGRGVLQPILLRWENSQREGFPFVIDGRRRIKAARKAGLTLIPCMWTVGGDELQLLGMGVAANIHRSANALSELVAIQAVQTANPQAPDVEIARLLNMPVATVRKRLKLNALAEGLCLALLNGRMSISTAERAARLPKVAQEYILTQAGDGRITGKAIQEARAIQVRASVAMWGDLGTPGAKAIDEVEADRFVPDDELTLWSQTCDMLKTDDLMMISVPAGTLAKMIDEIRCRRTI